MKRIYVVEYSALARNRIRQTLARVEDCQIIGEAEAANEGNQWEGGPEQIPPHPEVGGGRIRRRICTESAHTRDGLTPTLAGGGEDRLR